MCWDSSPNPKICNSPFPAVTSGLRILLSCLVIVLCLSIFLFFFLSHLVPGYNFRFSKTPQSRMSLASPHYSISFMIYQLHLWCINIDATSCCWNNLFLFFDFAFFSKSLSPRLQFPVFIKVVKTKSVDYHNTWSYH